MITTTCCVIVQKGAVFVYHKCSPTLSILKNAVPLFVFVMFAAMLTVTINDKNDCFPEFSKVGNLTFKENTEEGQLFGIILATDQDGPGFNEVKYYLM